MFKKSEPLNLAEYGLITDIPSNSTALSAWSGNLNMRAKDGSVQGVYKFEDSFAIDDSYNGALIDAKPISLTQWTPAGSGHLNIAYVIESQKTGEVGKGRVFVYNTNTQVTAEITNADASAAFTIDPKYPPQIFVFNELLVVNPGTGTPQYITADTTTNGNLDDLPGFASLAGTSNPRVMRPYKNRLVAMNWYDDKGTSSLTDDTYQPIDFVWSSNITDIGSLSGATWQVSTTNSAGDAFLTATPGKILDGKQLGDDFIVTKTDSVVRVTEVGEPLILGFETLLEDDGAFSARCIANIGNSQQLIVGNYGVTIHDGRGDKKDIAKGVFQDALYASVNPLHKDRSFVYLQTRDKEVWFNFSSKTNTGGGCDMAFVYEYNTGKLHIRSLPNVLDIYEAEIDGELKIFATSPDTKQILELSTTNHEAGGYFTITDKDLGDSSHTKEFDGIWINSEEEIKVGLSGNSFLKDVKSYTEVDFDPATEERVDFRDDGRYFSVRFTMIGDTNPKLTTVRFSTRISGD